MSSVISTEERCSLLFKHDEDGFIQLTNEASNEGDPAPNAFITVIEKDFSLRLSNSKNVIVQEVCTELIETYLTNFSNLNSIVERITNSDLSFNDKVNIEVSKVYKLGEGRNESGSIVISSANAEIIKQDFPYTYRHLNEFEPVVIVKSEDRIVSLCRTVRKLGKYCECGVDTIDEFKSRGFGKSAVYSWAKEINKKNLVALYTVEINNRPSEKLAKSIGGLLIGLDFSINMKDGI